MKATFKKDYSHWSVWLPGVLYFVAMGGTIVVMGIRDGNYSLILIPLPFIFFLWAIIRNPFHLTDDNKLYGNGTIDVPMINSLERKERGVTVHYLWPGGKTERERFFPLKDSDTFISTLLDINPNIKLN